MFQTLQIKVFNYGNTVDEIEIEQEVNSFCLNEQVIDIKVVRLRCGISYTVLYKKHVPIGGNRHDGKNE